MGCVIEVVVEEDRKETVDRLIMLRGTQLDCERGCLTTGWVGELGIGASLEASLLACGSCMRSLWLIGGLL